jgi:methionyl-tRNA formyltransferase
MAQPENLVFCGTPQFAVPTLEKLAEAGFNVRLVLTQPDRPKGRGLGLVASPVKQTALRLRLPVYQPEKIKENAELRVRLEEIAPAAIIVVGYGRIIPGWMLQLPKHGNINLHASLLPKYRGAAPIQWAVAMGDAYTGNTTMLLEEGLDTGPILLQQTIEIAPNQTSMELFEVLAHAGAPMVVETLAGLASGAITPQAQNHEGVTFAPLLDREDGRMDFTARTAHELYNRWRGFQPWPGAFTSLDSKKLIVQRMAVVDPSSISAPGTAKPGQLHTENNRLFAACAGETWLELLEVQLEGKKRLSAQDFLRGMPQASNARLG